MKENYIFFSLFCCFFLVACVLRLLVDNGIYRNLKLNNFGLAVFFLSVGFEYSFTSIFTSTVELKERKYERLNNLTVFFFLTKN